MTPSVAKCGALTKAGTPCKNPRGSCRWHVSSTKTPSASVKSKPKVVRKKAARGRKKAAPKRKAPSRKPTTSVPKKVDWAQIETKMYELGIGTDPKVGTAFDPKHVDVMAITAHESDTGALVPSPVYLKYYAWMKTWSAEAFARAMNAKAIVKKIERDIRAQVERVWKFQANHYLVKMYTSGGVSRTDMEQRYLEIFCDTFLSSPEIADLLKKSKLMDHTTPFGALVNLYTKAPIGDHDGD